MVKKRYNNYHKHTDYSNIRTLDCIVKPYDYIARAVELGHTNYFTTEHGYGGNVWEAYDLCKANKLKCIFAVEAYYVDDRLEKDSSNYHIVLVAKNNKGMKEINKIVSEANKTGFYYKPRIDLELLLQLNPENVYVTTACVGGRINRGEDPIQNFLMPVYCHFQDHFFLEVQSHNHPLQASHNRIMLELSDKYKIKCIHGNDSHYINKEDSHWRDLFLRGKGMFYEDEGGFILDYPEYDEILDRYKEQGILSREQAIEAIENTLVFDECEDLGLTKDIKMPSIYPNIDKNNKLKQILASKFKEEVGSNKYFNDLEAHKEAVRFEMDIIEKSVIENSDSSKAYMADYFLLNERIIDRAINKYNGVLTRTGRGSAVSFYLNKLLGFTEIDRVLAPVTLYPTRFMSTTRICESRSLPDIDFNWADVEAPIKASKDILGEDGVYYMFALGKMKESSAFRNLCRAYDMEMDEYNEVAKNLNNYYDDEKWGKIIKESERFLGVIESVSPSPCSFLLLDKPISEEVGLVKVGDILCACIDGYTSDVWKFLKNDFLTVKVWDIIGQTFKMIGKPIPSIEELNELLDDKVWKLYKDGIVATLNQVDSDFAKPKVMRYAPTSVAEMTAFVAGIRPAFASLLDNFLDRKPYSTGVTALDELLADSYAYMLYQESIMKFLVWCGIAEDTTYDIIKKIAKKKFKEHELEELKEILREGFIKQTGSDEHFEEIWQVVQDSASYAFNASHALSVALDSLYGAYLKANYPIEYYTVILNMYEGDTVETDKIVQELPYFGIELDTVKFRFSKSSYFFNKETNTIYKGMKSIKFLNESVSEELYALRNNHYDTFTDLLIDIAERTGCNSRQLKILIGLNFFSEFGGNKKLLFIQAYFEKRYKTTHKDKTKLVRIEEIKQYEESITDSKLNIREQIQCDLMYLGYTNETMEGIDNEYCIVTDINAKYKNPVLTLYHLKTGESEIIKVKKDNFDKNKFALYDMIKVTERKMENKWRKTATGFEMSKEKEPILKLWNIVK